MAAMRALAESYTRDEQAVVVIMQKKRSTSLLLSLGKFDSLDGGRVIWLPHLKQSHLGNAEATDNTLVELGDQVPILLTALSSALRAWVVDNAESMHDWYVVPVRHKYHTALCAHYHIGGSLDVITKAIADAKLPKKKEAVSVVTRVADEAVALEKEEPRRGRSSARAAKRQPSSSPATVKKETKKTASPATKKSATPATPTIRRSSRIPETPSEAMKKLSM